MPNVGARASVVAGLAAVSAAVVFVREPSVVTTKRHTK